MVKPLISHQVVSLLASQGTCVTGYGPQRTGTFDSCIYTKLQQIMVTQSEKFKRQTLTEFFSQMEGPGCTVHSHKLWGPLCTTQLSPASPFSETQIFTQGLTFILTVCSLKR